MAIRENETESTHGWERMVSGTLVRDVPEPLAGFGEVGIMPTAKVQRSGITTTESLRGGPPMSRCYECRGPIKPGTFPTASTARYGALICEECSTESGRPGEVQRARRGVAVRRSS